jgi:hypothetical protein
MIVLNGGREGNVRKLYAIAEITVPVPAMIVTQVEIEPIPGRGRFARRATFSFYKVAGGSGTVTRFRFRIDKSFRRGGREVSIVSAKCPDGKLESEVEASFTEGLFREKLTKPCRGRTG